MEGKFQDFEQAAFWLHVVIAAALLIFVVAGKQSVEWLGATLVPVDFPALPLAPELHS